MKRFLILFMLAFCVSCGVSRSELLKDTTIPTVCKCYFECLYFIGKAQVKDFSGCSQFADGCRKNIIFDKCKKEYKDVRDIQNCLDKLN